MALISATSGDRDFTFTRATHGDEWPVLALFLIVQAVAWAGIPAVMLSAPHANTVELALWGRDWFVVNYKHPALPAWLLAVGYDLFGTHLWVSLVLSEFCIGTAYLFVFLLGRDLIGARAALF